MTCLGKYQMKNKKERCEVGSNLENYHNIIKYISKDIREVLLKISMERIASLEEIRLRANKPLIVQNFYEDWFISKNGGFAKDPEKAFIVGSEEISKTLEIMSRNSIYAFQDDIKKGFLTLPGGHRVGIAGKTITEDKKIVNIKEITSLNIRISKEIKGCSLKILKYVIHNEINIYNTLIVSPPQCGKTTILRDLTRVLSNGIKEKGFRGIQIGLIDERSEIAACYNGVPQFDVGMRTDILDGCPKSIGMIMMIRSMSPQIVITDEIGDQGDKDSIITILNAGIKIIATAHGFNISELESRKEVLNLIEEKVFERYIVLSNENGPGTIEEVVDGNMNLIYKRKVRRAYL
jgi:stage III sporulation protein AA